MQLSDLKVGMKIGWHGADGTVYEVFQIHENYAVLGWWYNGKQLTMNWSTFEYASVVSEGKPKKKHDYDKSRKQLYLVSTVGGMTHKGIANVLNKRKVDTFGNNPTHALSVWQDKHQKKIDVKNAIVWKLVPHKLRKDSNGRYRIGREIK